ncbi:MAG: GldG family protein, partial [Kiritimatiellia bacterium]|nr:GldG family protein [Kiritimatiellia bacterium]
KFYGLSEQTLSILRTVNQPVEVTLLFQSGQEGVTDIENLLREYEYHCPHLRVSRVNPDRDPARTRALLETYPVTRANVLIVSAKGGHRIIEREDLFTYDVSRVRDGGRPIVSSFRGEKEISSAIDGLIFGKRPLVYFIEGHGERSIESLESRTGLAELARRVGQNNIEVRILRLGEVRTIPEDCDVLVIAGPRQRLSQPEVDLIGDYLLRRGGRFLALLDAQTTTGLEPLLLRWGVRVGNDVVVDPSRTVTGRELFIQAYGPHPVTAPLQGLTSILTLPRSIEPAGPETDPNASDRPVVTRLALTTPAGWAESDPAQRPLAFDEGVDRTGPISVAVAVEKGYSKGIEVQIRPTRMVIIGDSFFLANENQSGANAQFFLNALHWMLDRPELLAIPPRSTADFQIALTSAQVQAIGWLVLLGMPAAAALLGWFVALRRRR